ncbi:MAG TPA: D-glycero-beta-D-manno-heptose 1-phosphate adenylyltransferase [Candidatus Acidoferrales bacterium]|nr:D-glycero-beta-D-manno-heptose 1-phosphate adenylyltransferase [Candidatus Acidoferrales bacterium]
MPSKFRPVDELKQTVARAKRQGKKIVFTNGCFDLLHCGHLRLLREAKKLGDLLIVAINEDASVRGLKGANRPVLPLAERAELLAALEMVDYVTSFAEADPCRLIRELEPDVLVKGGDWSKDEVVGRELVEARGGRVEVVPYLEGHSTSEIIERIRRA